MPLDSGKCNCGTVIIKKFIIKKFIIKEFISVLGAGDVAIGRVLRSTGGRQTINKLTTGEGHYVL